MMDQKGLYPKYEVRKRTTGEVVMDDFFILKPGNDPAARAALRAYAAATSNKELRKDIMGWVDHIEAKGRT